LFFLRRLVVKTTGLDDLIINIELVSRTRVHGFFDAFLGDETEDTDSLSLTDTVSTILSLKISMGIPAASSASLSKQYPEVYSPITIEAADPSISIGTTWLQEDNTHDNRIRSLQVKAQATSSCGQNEDFDV
jgi:hypothetical protein